jgi:hypothetical protein
LLVTKTCNGISRQSSRISCCSFQPLNQRNLTPLLCC